MYISLEGVFKMLTYSVFPSFFSKGMNLINVYFHMGRLKTLREILEVQRADILSTLTGTVGHLLSIMSLKNLIVKYS